MKKMFVYFLLPLLMCMSIGYAQTLTVSTYGLSERDASRADTLAVPGINNSTVTKYFDVRYNGLQNVGNQTKVFLKANMSGAKLASPVWTFLSKPYASTVTFGTTYNIDTSNQVITFVPDKVGTYKIVCTDGTKKDTITINSSNYVGYATGACNFCHNGFVTPDKIFSNWQKTKHSTTLVRGLDGILSSHFQASCLKCHTTGYDTNASNGGFDDFSFTFPTVMQVGMYDSMKAVYPDAMVFANVQCESCHGPGKDHYSATDDFKIQKTLDPDLCSYCHDSGTHHYFGEQYDYSVHANPTTLARGSSTSCAPCHSGSGFIEYIKGGKQALSSAPDLAKIACATCHDPHDATNEHQLRTVSVTLGNGYSPTIGGNGRLCMNCHKSRQNAIAYTDDYLNNLSSHFGPHHGPQADMLLGQNGVTFGLNLPSSAHKGAATNACVDCHMAPNSVPVTLVGEHTFNMKFPDGTDNVGACAQSGCHASFGTKFSDKKFYVNGSADLDQNGTAEGLQIEIQGLLDRLAKLLPPVGSTTVDPINDSTLTKVVAQAFYNWDMVTEDRSLGIHNPAWAYSLLAASIGKLDGTTGIELINNSIPDTYVLSQNYPNPFNPSTRIKFSIPEQTNVKLLVYDILGREVTQLVNQVMNAGTYTFNWDAKGNASGIYFYKLQTEKFVKVNKMILLK